MKYIRNIIEVSISNIVSFGTSFIIGFILPALLTVSEYGNYKQFVLFATFGYIFNLGFNDGIYIKYGGMSEEDVKRNQVSKEHNFILLFHIVQLIIMLIFSLITTNLFFILYSFIVFFMNIVTYHQNFLQATGQFKLFSRTNILKSILYILALIIVAFFFKNKNSYSYIFLYILSFSFLFFLYEYNFWNKYKKNIFIEFNFKNMVHIFKIGIFILIANLSQSFVANIGNWVVNIKFSIEDFARYSFQNSLLNIILLIVNAIGLVFFNFISSSDDTKIYRIINEFSVFAGIASGLVFFIFKIIINIFLPTYSASINLLAITFISIPFIISSRILFANLYKLKRSEKKYFKDSFIFAIISLIIVTLLGYFSNNLYMVAIGTSLCYVGWYFYCVFFEFKYLKNTFSDFIILIAYILVFTLCSVFLDLFSGFLVYLCYIFLLLFIKRFWIKNLFKNFTN